MLQIILLIFLGSAVHSQFCLNQDGDPIEWWVILKIPPKIGNSGYAYYDSQMQTGSFQYYPDKVDS